ncbi:BON domain-containing protein [Rhodopirellula sp. MGV]|uniref:BON domain-containing protein n=1 Tax=Rhodopirellula sp. MGV TaxID=2023130 RepID=UPI00117A37CF|nr:BON domain-containing protein [Rhodopirellula sp. MGV]
MSSSSGDFGGVERGASIGSTNVQGFGAAAESTGGSGLGGATGGRAGGAGGLGGLGGLFGALGNAFGAQSGSATKPTIRVRLRSAVEVAPMSSDRVQAAATSVFNRVPVTSGVRNVNVTMDGRTAILTGTVGSEKDRRMSELLIRLEPGVSQIDNRVSVVE